MRVNRLIGGTVDGMHMFWKRMLSYRKKEWQLADYPIRMRIQKDSAPNDRYWARVLGWLIDATGRTPSDAMVELQHRFDAQKALCAEEGKPQPRPGTEVPISFASSERVDSDAALREDFIHRVLELEWTFISDGSSLWDFHTERTNDELNARIKEVYGADVSDIESGNIAEILERIASVRARQQSSLI
ncbi:MAG TPA: hypothetical protein VFU55_03205 [Terracidiphilus sp.]|nr:hypothetical protein [Terracidiphilus sp.]